MSIEIVGVNPFVELTWDEYDSLTPEEYSKKKEEAAKAGYSDVFDYMYNQIVEEAMAQAEDEASEYDEDEIVWTEDELYTLWAIDNIPDKYLPNSVEAWKCMEDSLNSSCL